jgi:hypothetical protein
MASFFARPKADRSLRFRLGWYLAMAILWFVGLSVAMTLIYRVVPPPVTLTMLFDKTVSKIVDAPLAHRPQNGGRGHRGRGSALLRPPRL